MVIGLLQSLIRVANTDLNKGIVIVLALKPSYLNMYRKLSACSLNISGNSSPLFMLVLKFIF